jgi:hypothetical protein
MLALMKGASTEMLELLLDNDADITAVDEVPHSCVLLLL